MNDIDFPDICPECGGKIIHRQKEGDFVCSSCGLVVGKKLVNLKEASVKRDYREFYGYPQHPWAHSASFGSDIGFSEGSIDKKRVQLSPEMKVKMLRLKKIQKYRNSESKDRGMVILRNILNQTCLPSNIKSDTTKYFINAINKRLTVGRTYEDIIAAAIFLAHKTNKKSIGFKKLAKEIMVSKKALMRCCQLLIRELKIKVNIIFKPIDFLGEISGKVGIDAAVEKRAAEIIKEFEETKNISGKDPLGITAAALYIASKEFGNGITQKKLASAGEVAELTLRKRYKEIEKVIYKKSN